MPRGKSAYSGRGRGSGPRGGARGARGGRGGARGGAGNGARDANVAKPALKELPAELLFTPTHDPVPPTISDALPEFSGAQTFFSSLERICPEYQGSVEGYNRCWVGVPSDSVTGFSREADSAFHATLSTTGGDHPVFIKRIHLLHPEEAMEGEYIWPRDGALPAPSEPWRNALTKINDPNNEAYVDALFAMLASRLAESGTSPHWCRAYGTFSARVEKYMHNISDIYDSVRRKPWWRRNQRNGLFKIFDPAKEEGDVVARPTFSATGYDLAGDDFTELGAEDALSATTDAVIAEEKEPELAPDASVQLSTPKIRLSRISGSDTTSDSSSSEDADDEGSDDSEEDEEMYVEFADFPVQVTLLERATGTLDELLDDEEMDPSLAQTRDARWGAWLFQIIAALCAAQYTYGFVHNDLHTNNVMWVTTDAEWFYYRVHKGKASWILRVPTYGRLLKIIDFGRATFTLPEPGGFFISDAFYPGNDAGEQYNCEPFYDSADGQRVEPNPSFDLCRLSVGLLESLYPERPEPVKPVRAMSREGAKMYTETVSEVYNMLWSWLQDDSGRNVLRKPDGEERYPDFDLYKAIAAEVHGAVPCRQLERPLFAGYKYTGAVEAGTPVYDLHIL